MQFSLLALSGLSAIAAATAIPAAWDLEGRQVPSKPCSQLTGGVHVIATPGEGSADPPYGLLGSLSRSILAAIPGSVSTSSCCKSGGGYSNQADHASQTNVSVPYNHADTVGTRQSDGAVSHDHPFFENSVCSPSPGSNDQQVHPAIPTSLPVYSHGLARLQQWCHRNNERLVWRDKPTIPA